MRVSAALSGSLIKLLETEREAAKKAVTAGVRQATNGLKTDLRTQVTSAGLGNRLAKTWRGNLYPKGGKSLNAAGFVFSKAPEIISAFATGVTIRSTTGRYLAIPTPYVSRLRGRRRTPQDLVNAGVPLRFIPPAGARKLGLLVADNQRISSKGKVRNASQRALKTGKGLASVVMFILVPQVSLRKRLNLDKPAHHWISRLPQLVVDAWEEK